MTSQLSPWAADWFLARISERASEVACYTVVHKDGRAVFIAPTPDVDGDANASERATAFGYRYGGAKYQILDTGEEVLLRTFGKFRLCGGVPKTTRRGGPRQMRRR
jgi:hypothetical protein